MSTDLTSVVLQTARKAGAHAVGVTMSTPFFEARDRLRLHIRRGTSGPLRFTYDDPDTATDVGRTFPWANSLISVGRSYIGDAPPPSRRGPVVARFATRDHYRSIRAIADALGDVLHDFGFRAESLIDDNRLVDRGAALRSGTGWLGRNTMVLTPANGPWMLLGTVATDARLTPTSPMKRSCGTCTACLPACPTAALSDDGLDARRCISTWLQSPGSIPHWIRPAIGSRIYGCDDCLTACPPGHKSMANAEVRDKPVSFTELLDLSDDKLVSRFSWWYIPRRDGRYLRRNLLIAAGNSKEEESIAAVEAHLTHTSSLIRGIAAWAYARAIGRDAMPQLKVASLRETAPETVEELRLAMLMVTEPAVYQDEIGTGPT